MTATTATATTDRFKVTRDRACDNACWKRCRVVRDTSTDRVVTGHMSQREAARVCAEMNKAAS